MTELCDIKSYECIGRTYGSKKIRNFAWIVLNLQNHWPQKMFDQMLMSTVLVPLLVQTNGRILILLTAEIINNNF